MRNELFQKNYTAEGTINPYRIVKFGTADGGILQAGAVTDVLVGVVGRLGPAGTTAATGDRVDVIRAGIAEVEYGGNVTVGAWLTTDANGKAVAAAPAAGTNNNVIGQAEVGGVSGDIGSVFLTPCRIQG